jgi:predicted lipoprotein with Yx(FWY)xxD motif
MRTAQRFTPLAAMVACALAVVLGASGSTSRATVSMAKNAALGTIVVGSSGRTLYHYLDDHGSKIDCTGACAKQWPPVLIPKSARPVAGAGVKAAKLGTVARPDGTVQVTYYGFPLYRFAGDTRTGQVNGQGLEHSWYVLAPSGAIVKTSAAPAAAGSSGSSTSGSSSTSSGTSGSTGSSSGGSMGGGYSDY